MEPMEAVGYIVTSLVGGFFALMALAIGISWVVSLFEKPEPAKLAGTAIPELGEGFDIQKRYGILYSGGDYGSQFFEKLEGVEIIGYVGNSDEESIGKGYVRSRWLVVAFEDGRKAYLMPHAIISLKETEPA